MGCHPETAARLVELVQQPPQLHGLARSRWRLQDLRQALPALRDYSLPGISKLLTRLGIRRSRGRFWVHSPDPAYQQKLDRIADTARGVRHDPAQVVLLYADEYSLYRQPTLATCLSRQGCEPRARLSWRGNRYHRYSAALNSQTGQVSWVAAARMNVPNLVRFLQHLRQDYPTQTLYLVWDNWPVHRHARVLAALDQLQIIVLWLPTYAPWTNPIEKLWRWAKQTLVHYHRCADAPAQLQQQLASFLDQFQDGSEDLLRYVGLVPK